MEKGYSPEQETGQLARNNEQFAVRWLGRETSLETL